MKTKGMIALLTLALLLTIMTPGAVIAQDKQLNIVATTTMLADLARVIGGEHVLVTGMMGPGIDPHLYQASAGDVMRMQEANVIVFNGLHLEGKMGDVFEALGERDHAIISIEDGLDKTKLLFDEEDAGVPDPHFWFDVSLWMDAARYFTQELSKLDQSNALYYRNTLNNYLMKLEELDTYIKMRIGELVLDQRVLITAHDAFQYFGRAYGIEVRGLQGISTVAEAGTADVSNLADFIVKRQIKAIFVESSVPTKTIEALQAAVKSRGFEVKIGGELYSDSLGDETSGNDTYITTVQANIDTIVDALR
ncbi:MAG: metal ABC transporter solute-binding protein, Zn/Mn family [Christensenellales bacterium]|jgi:manganese/zinc/iron transport system substrate-binding protein|nr:zinc ABC transporter solute-binding protein [Clostridiales bacterium]